MKVKVINKSNNELPTYATNGSAGVDLRASITDIDLANPNGFKGNRFHVDSELKEITLFINGRIIIPTDLYMAIPEGYELQIRPRSGLAIKDGITCLNTPGTIDSDYRGNVGVILINHGDKPFVIKNGDKIAQAILCKYNKIEFEVVDELPETKRGEGGYGSTGK